MKGEIELGEEMSDIVRRSMAKTLVADGEWYLIRRHGSWYRPNAAGYTRDLLLAGVYRGEIARQHLGEGGCSLVPLSALSAEIFAEMTVSLKRVEKAMGLAALISS